MMCSSVLLPEPEGPTIASDSPAATSMVMPSSTASEPALPGESKRLATLLSFNRGSGNGMSWVLSGFGLRILTNRPCQSCHPFRVHRTRRFATHLEGRAHDEAFSKGQVIAHIRERHAATEHDFR